MNRGSPINLLYLNWVQTTSTAFLDPTTLGPNVAIHGEISAALAGREPDDDQLDRLYKILEYRLTLMKLAEWFVRLVGMKAARDELCAQWDFEKWFYQLDSGSRSRFKGIVRMVFSSGLFDTAVRTG